jgi:hypothetical protein
MNNKFKLQNRSSQSAKTQNRETDSREVRGPNVESRNVESGETAAGRLDSSILDPATLDSSILDSSILASTITDLRSLLQYLASRQAAPSAIAAWLDPARRRARSRQRRRVAAFAFTVLAAVALLPLSLQHRGPQLQNQAGIQSSAHTATPSGIQSAASQPAVVSPASSDNALLDQVDTEVSESVPSALAPLAELQNISSSSTQSDLNQMESTNAPQIR